MSKQKKTEAPTQETKTPRWVHGTRGVLPPSERHSVCGFLTDGTNYKVAPMRSDEFQAILDEEAGLARFIEASNAQLQGQYAALQRRRSHCLAAIANDIGIDLSDGWTYAAGVLKPAPKEPSPPASADAQTAKASQ